MAKVYIDSNNKVITYGNKALIRGEAPNVTFTVYGSRASIDSVTQTALTDTALQVDMVLTLLVDLTSSQNTLLNTTNPSGYTIISGVGSFYLNDATSTIYSISWSSNKVDFSGAKSTGDKVHASFILVETKNS